MKVYENKELNLEAHSLDKTTWEDFQELFGERGACGGCWCMSWRLRKSVFESQKGNENKRAMKALVDDGETIGVIVYINEKPMGWCAVAPREKYIRLENSKVFKRVDDEPVWSITCLYLLKEYRRQGFSTELIKAAVSYCELNQVQIVEAYPVVPYDDKIPDPFIWTGTPSAFKEAGFFVAEQRSRWKLMMRYYI